MIQRSEIHLSLVVMSGRTKRAMAPPPDQTGSAPSYHIGSAPASANQVPTPVPAFLGGGSTIPSTASQAGNRFCSWFSIKCCLN